jgi:hypothetical protein
LGAINLRPSLGQHALDGPARLFVAMDTATSSSTGYGHRNFGYDVIDNLLHSTYLSRSYWVSSDTGD